jgi:hypothetical protein
MYGGVLHVDELWNLIKDRESPLKVVLFTKDETFEYEPFRVWWSHGNFLYETSPEVEHSQIIFDIPDNAWRRIQEIYCSKQKARFISPHPCEIPKAIRSDRDDTRVADPQVFAGDGITREDFTTEDWPKLKQAIEATVSSLPGGMCYRKIVLHGGIFGEARINGEKLEISIDAAITEAVENWQSGIRRKFLGLPS